MPDPTLTNRPWDEHLIRYGMRPTHNGVEMT